MPGKSRPYILYAVIALLAIGLGWAIFSSSPSTTQPPANSDQNTNPGNPNVELLSPTPGSLVKSPLTVTGRARGTWYFEATFPVQILDANDNVLGRVPAQAQSDWMTTEFVPFVANVTFQNSLTPTGFLILKKDNPSGLPQNEQEVRYPIRFK